ncbi:hypothetical protein EHM69_08080 [candidate division KSB1 bacterium]|nr:MAG: hypothetical protein EHM69_08080 [candidate division KSB1 bacterium]
MKTLVLHLLPVVAIGIMTCACSAGITVTTLSVENKANPGQTYQGTLTLSNTDSVPRRALIYQTDYAFFSDGSNHYDEPGDMARSNAPWITYSPHQVDVPPQRTSQLTYSVRVPDDSTLTGTYWSILMVEEVEMPEDPPAQLQRRQTEIRQVVRYGIQCVTHVGTAGHGKLNFTDTKLVANEDNRRELQVDVENTGERWMIPSAWLELYDSGGKQVGRFESEKKRIYPGTSVRFRMNLGSTPAGKYKALVVLDNGDQNVFGAKYDLEF